MIPTDTLERFVYRQQRLHTNTTGELSDLLTSVALAVKMISRLVATAGLKGLYGYTGKTNIQGEATRILDEEADEILMQVLASSGHFGLLISEERDSIVAADKEVLLSHGRKYIVAFDPLDGSSNLGSNIPVGTIFSIFTKQDVKRPASMDDFMQAGSKIVAAGYAIYGAKTSFVYSCADGVHGFTFDPSIGEFMLTDENIQTPSHGHTYSVNEGNYWSWAQGVRAFVDTLKLSDAKLGTPYSGRYVGSLVADFDRNLKTGGIFLYPADSRYPRGKLRLLYECMPLAYIAEQAGGVAIDGEKNILEIVPEDIHQRAPLIIGGRDEVELFRRVCGQCQVGSDSLVPTE